MTPNLPLRGHNSLPTWEEGRGEEGGGQGQGAQLLLFLLDGKEGGVGEGLQVGEQIARLPIQGDVSYLGGE